MFSKEMIDSLGLTRAIAVTILNMFEDVLDKHGIYIPDDDRNGGDDEACLYGMTYAKLEDEIVELLHEYVVDLR